MYTLEIIGRVIFGLFFVQAGIKHFAFIENMSGYAKMKGLPMPKPAVAGSGLLLILGGLGVIFNFHVRIADLCLVLFLIPTSFMMHNFWSVTDPQAKMGEQVNFLKNMAILGAVVMMLGMTVKW